MSDLVGSVIDVKQCLNLLQTFIRPCSHRFEHVSDIPNNYQTFSSFGYTFCWNFQTLAWPISVTCLTFFEHFPDWFQISFQTDSNCFRQISSTRRTFLNTCSKEMPDQTTLAEPTRSDGLNQLNWSWPHRHGPEALLWGSSLKDELTRTEPQPSCISGVRRASPACLTRAELGNRFRFVRARRDAA